MNEPTSVSPARADGRRPDQLRPVRFQNHIAPHATGSTLIEWGNTRVICAVMVEEAVPAWMKAKKVEGGWLTAEYSMLPYSTTDRKARDISRLKLDGRSQEIQRLIGRSLRAVVNLVQLGSRTFWVDCDVLQADGGTRTASITGAFVALSLAVKKLQAEGKLAAAPFEGGVAAVSLGVVAGQPVLDLNYAEDSAASVDLNLVMNASGEFIELQASGEEATFGQEHLTEMLRLGRLGIAQLLELQRQAVAAAWKTALYLVRHGEVETRYHRIFGGSRIDMELSPSGHEQAARLAGWLARIEFNAVYASPMRRVQLTYEPFRRHFPGEPVVLPGLREIDFGDWTGFGWNEVEERFGMSAYDWLEHLEHDRVQGAESLADFRRRIDASMDQILKEQTGRTVAVFCHGGVIRGMLSHLLDQPLRWFEHVEIDYASATWVDVGILKAGRARNEIQLLNFTPWRDLP